MATINGKLISTKGKLADKEFEIDKIRGLALAAPGGGRVEIRFNRVQNTYNLVSQGYPVAVNGQKTEKQDINDGDIIVVGTNEFRFLFPQAEAPKDETAEIDKFDSLDTDKNIPAINEDNIAVTDTVQVSKVEFCDVCSVPVTEIDFRKGQAKKVGDEIFCLECFGERSPASKPKAPTPKAAKPAGRAKPEGRAPAARRRGAGGRGGGRAARRKGGSAAAQPVKSARKAATSKRRPVAKPNMDKGTEELDMIDTPAPAAKPARKAGSSKPKPAVNKGTEALDEAALEPTPAKPARKKVKPPVEALEPLAETPAAPRARKRTPAPAKMKARRVTPLEDGPAETERPSRASGRRKKESDASSSSRKSAREKPVKTGPGLAAKILGGIGKIFAAIAKGILAVIGKVFAAIGRILKSRKLRKAIRKEEQQIGAAIRKESANMMFVPDNLLEKAARLKALGLDDTVSEEERSKTAAELGQRFVEEYFDESREAEVIKRLKTIGDLEEDISALKDGEAGEAKPDKKSRSGRRRSASKRGSGASGRKGPVKQDKGEKTDSEKVKGDTGSTKPVKPIKAETPAAAEDDPDSDED